MTVFNQFNAALRAAPGAITQAANDFGTAVTQSGQGFLSKITSKVDPKLSRLIGSGLAPGGKNIAAGLGGFNTQVSFGGLKENIDWRVKITVGENSNIFYLDPKVGEILAPLKETNGVVFPYTPRIDTVMQANYQDYDITHTNYGYFSYNRSSVSSISITAEFTAQTPEEAKYVLAVIHFFRSVGKMFTGRDSLAGNPPALVYLDGYGQHYFPHVPCVLTQFSHSMPDDVDYISAPSLSLAQLATPGPGELPFPSGAATFRTKIPTVSSMTIQLQPSYSRKKVADFSTERFARGEYLNQGYI